MANGRRAWLLVGLLLMGAGCGDGAPFEELPLRDALRAEPEAVAALPPAARRHLAERLEAARGADLGRDAVGEGADPGALVAALDAARARRS
ncbi:MAG TPA: hypothetical protein VHO06_01295, partial [Polyangia bacterium]|nr:hypothetical protein [Polyangia bacterium]